MQEQDKDLDRLKAFVEEAGGKPRELAQEEQAALIDKFTAKIAKAEAASQPAQGVGLTDEDRAAIQSAINCLIVVNAQATADRLGAILARQAAPTQPELTVWYGPMPESNGKSNFTATLIRKGAPLLDGLTGGYTFAQSEYPDRVRYEADCMRYLIGELANEPWILDYDADKHSGYKEPVAPTLDSAPQGDAKCARCGGEGMIYVEEAFQPCPDCQDLTDYDEQDDGDDAIARKTAAPQQPAPQGEDEPPLPKCAAYGYIGADGFDPHNGHKQLIGLSVQPGGSYMKSCEVELFTADQVRADRRTYHAHMMRKLGDGVSVDTPEFRKLLAAVQGWHDGEPVMEGDAQDLIAHIDAKLAAAIEPHMARCDEMRDALWKCKEELSQARAAGAERASQLLTAAKDVLATELGEMASAGSMAPCEHALGVLAQAVKDAERAGTVGAERAVPEGWQVVPKFSTSKIDAVLYWHTGRQTVSRIWSELLAAAPSPAQVAQEGEQKKKRLTWKTDGGFKCLNCGKSLIDHAAQIYCPAQQTSAQPTAICTIKGCTSPATVSHLRICESHYAEFSAWRDQQDSAREGGAA